MIKETAEKDPHVSIFKIHILSLKLTYQKVDYTDDQSEPFCICRATMVFFCLTDL